MTYVADATSLRSLIRFQSLGSAQTFIAWGAQLEAGAFPTSYIKNIDTVLGVTRAADVASITGTNFSSFYNQTEGTVFADASSDQANGGTRFPILFQGATFNDRMVVGVASTNQYQTFYANNNVAQANLTTGTYTPSTRFGMSAAYATNDIAQSVNGASTQTDTSVTLMTPTQLFIGFASAYFGGTIRRLTYFPIRLANSTLQAITQP